MAKPKMLLPYILGLVSLLISLGLVSRGEWIKAEELPPPTPSATPLPKPEPFPGAARMARCQAPSQPRFFFYTPTLTDDIPQSLLISGTVYASDLSPLSNALVEIWQTDDNQVNQPVLPVLFSTAVRTDEAGHYRFITMRFIPSGQAYLHLRISHRDYCRLLLNLHPVVESQPRPARQIFAQIQVDGPVLRGPVDIVMPVPAFRQ